MGMRKYIWIIDATQFNKLKTAKSSEMVFSKMQYFNIPDVGRVSFVFNLQRKGNGSSSAGIGIQIKGTDVPVDGRWSVIVEEVGYSRNDIRFHRLKRNGYDGKFAF